MHAGINLTSVGVIGSLNISPACVGLPNPYDMNKFIFSISSTLCVARKMLNYMHNNNDDDIQNLYSTIYNLFTKTYRACKANLHELTVHLYIYIYIYIHTCTHTNTQSPKYITY